MHRTKDWVWINNRKNFLVGEVPSINPLSRKYNSWWRCMKKRGIEGFWSIDDANVTVDASEIDPKFPKESDKWRWIPGNTFFYVNFGTILANEKGAARSAPKKPITPRLDDLEWELGYKWIEARGFSGFEFDEEYSCNRNLLDDDLSDDDLKSECLKQGGEINQLLYRNYFNDDGTRKKYKPCRQYVKSLFTKPMGLPIYGNTAKNLMLVSSRDGGKTEGSAGQIVTPELLFDGAKYYDEESRSNPALTEIIVGAAIATKSTDMLKKVKRNIENLKGIWKKNTSSEVPSPFKKHMSGSLSPGETWRHEYDKKIGNDWKTFGTGSFIKHLIFTINNPEAAAGGRSTTIVIEEVGLVPNLLTILGSNDAVQNDGGVKFGSTMALGTGGNIEKVIETEIVFKDPEGYDFMIFENEWEEDNSDIGWFIPAPYMARGMKDENGNTRVEEAYAFFEKRRARKKKAASRKAIDLELMNYPFLPSEMFVNANQNMFPIMDLKQHYGKLMTTKGLLDVSYKGHFGLNSSGSAEWSNEKKTPIREFPMKKGDEHTMNGCIEIYEMPHKNYDGIVPANVYLAGYDPIDDDDDSDITRSLQSFWIMNSLTGRLVLEHTGRTGLASEFYEQCRRSLLFYNAKVNYENNKKGFYGHMFNKAGLHMLSETPEILMQKDMQKSRGTGNKGYGTNMQPAVIKYGEELLLKWLTEQAYEKSDGVMNLHTIKSPALLKELMAYNPKGNFDRISALFTLMIIREDKVRIVKRVKEKIHRALDDEFFDIFRGDKKTSYH